MPSHTVEEIVKQLRAGRMSLEDATARIRNIFVREGRSPQAAFDEAQRTVIGSLPQPAVGQASLPGGPGPTPLTPPGPPGDPFLDEIWRTLRPPSTRKEGEVIWEQEYPTFSDDAPYGAGPGGAGPGGGGVQPSPGISFGGIPEDATRLLSEDFTGREELFSRYLAGLGQAVPAIARHLIQRRGNPLSAQFLLSQLSPTVGQVPEDFTEFLGTNPQRFTAGQYQQAFQGLAPLFQQGAQLTERQGLALEELATIDQRTLTQPVARNLISQSFLAGVPPVLRRAAGTYLNRAFDQYRSQNPAGDLFADFVKRGFRL